jgi:hypothetical protein
MHKATPLMMLVALLSGAVVSGQSAPQPAGGAMPKASSDNRLSTLAGFTIDYPKKDWAPAVGTGSSLVVFIHKSNDATVAVERTKAGRPLASSDINEQTVTLEIEEWQNRRPQASGFSHSFLDFNGARTMVIDFSQPGPEGPEHVRMYTMPRGIDWFRVICTSTQTTFERYKEPCHKIAMSLSPTP